MLALQGNDTIRENKLIKRFLKGVFNKKKTALPKYSYTWNVSTVLQYLKKLLPSENLSLLLLSCKLAMLFALLSGQRGQTLYLIDIRNIEFRYKTVVVRIGDLLKPSSPTIHSGELVLEGYTKDTDMCILNVLKTHLEYTKLLRGSGTRLFIASQKPHHPISRDNFSRWIRQVLLSAGIDLSLFSPHSTRSAATSAVEKRVPVNTILKVASWQKECSFRKFYNKPAMDTGFSKAINSIILGW